MRTNACPGPALKAKDMRLSYYWARRMQQYKDFCTDRIHTEIRSSSGSHAELPGAGTLGLAKEARRGSAREIDGSGQGFTLLATGCVRGIV